MFLHESIQWMYTFHLMHSDLWILCAHRWDMEKGGVGFLANGVSNCGTERSASITIQVRLRSVCFSPLLFSVGKVLENREAIIQQKNELDKTSQQLKHDNLEKAKDNTRFRDWYDSEKSSGSKMAKELEHCKSRLKELRSCVFNLQRKVSGLKAKLSPSRSMMSKLLCREKVSWCNRCRTRA